MSTLYIGNLSPDTTQESLAAALAAIGEVREISLATDRETGQSKGFAFVTMGSAEAANNVINRLNGTMLDGHPLKIDVAKSDKSGRSRYGASSGRNLGR